MHFQINQILKTLISHLKSHNNNEHFTLRPTCFAHVVSFVILFECLQEPSTSVLMPPCYSLLHSNSQSVSHLTAFEWFSHAPHVVQWTMRFRWQSVCLCWQICKFCHILKGFISCHYVMITSSILVMRHE